MKSPKLLLPLLLGAAIAVPATLSILPTTAQEGPVVVGPIPLPPQGAVTMFFDSFFSDNLGQPANDFNGFIQWNVTGGTVDFLGGRVIGANDPVNGRFVDLDGGTPGRFQTRIPFVFAPNTTYNISFTYMSTDGQPNSAIIGIGSKRLRVATSSSTMQSFSQNFSFSSAETAPLFFQDEGRDDRGLGIDNVVLSVFPVAPTPAPNPTATPVTAPTPTATSTATPTATVAPTATPTVTATPGPGATPTETAAPTATPSGTPGATPTVTPTPGPAPSNSAPVNLSLRPTRVATASGVLQSFTATVSDANGAGDIDRVILRASGQRFNNHALIALYSATQNRLFLYDDAGSRLLGGAAPGSSAVISNSQGALDCRTTTVTRSGNTLTVSFSLYAAPSQSGMVLPLMLLTHDKAGLRDGYELRGYWTISGNVRPSNMGLSPATASNRPNETRLFTATYSDSNGFDNLRQVRLRARAANAQTQADFFSVVYDVQSDRLFVVNDANTGFVRSDGARPGTRGTVSNRLGTLDVGATRVVRRGNTLSVVWAIRASSRFTGSHAISLIAQDPALRTSEQVLGSWNVVTSTPPSR